MQLDFNIDIFI